MAWILELGKSLKRPALILGSGCLLLLFLFVLVPDPLAQRLEASSLPARPPFFLGTDHLGRDLGARLYFGFLRSSGMVLLTLVTTLIVAIPTSLVAAKFRNADAVLEVIAAAVWSIPTVILGLIVFVGFKGEWIPLKFAVLGVFNWVPIFRVARDLTKLAQMSPYVTFSRAVGMTERRVYAFHVFPNVLPKLFPIILLSLVSLFEAEFVLGFLGLSYPDPLPTLGGLLRQGINYLNLNMILLPSGLLALLVLAIIFLHQNLTQPR